MQKTVSATYSMYTTHRINIGNSNNMKFIDDDSIDLVVTSPPYPMITMWDEGFISQDGNIAFLLEGNPDEAFELMHKQLDQVWTECHRVLKDGGFLCINIGDATRTINGSFKLYNNHSRILQACTKLGFVSLPDIIWRKQTNAPNKFMGSGMLPCGAYVTLEHEWILIFRKGEKRKYKTAEEKLARMRSSFFWEERNVWFSDVWDVKGIKQKITKSATRDRSAAFPFEIPFRLINMFSQKDDIVLDPFIGTGTTAKAAIVTGRNSIGYEIDPNFSPIIRQGIKDMSVVDCNNFIKQRFDNHVAFVRERIKQGKEVKHYNKPLHTPVMTSQEEELAFNYIKSISADEDGVFTVEYETNSNLEYSFNHIFSKVI